MKILIVDDDVNTVDVIRDSIDWNLLHIDGVLWAYGVAKAQEIVKTEKPEIILCDIEMPGQSGLDFLRWIREKEIETEFIFLTCHNDFDFASEAIEYGAMGYVMKPFHMQKMVSTILKAVSRVSHNQMIGRYVEYGKYVVSNTNRTISNFWDEISREKDTGNMKILIENAVRIGIASDQECYRIILACAIKTEDDIEEYMQFMLKNVASEIILGDVSAPEAISYDMEGRNCVLLFVKESDSLSMLKGRVHSFMEAASKYLQRAVNCYIGEPYPLMEMAMARNRLNEICLETPVIGGEMILQNEITRKNYSAFHALDHEKYREWINDGMQLKIIRQLKAEIEQLPLDNKRAGFDGIFYDYLQILYAVLAEHGVQVHVLLDDDVYKKLLKSADHSAYDFIKWAGYATQKTLEFLNNTKKEKDIIEKAKKYISQHYGEEITRNEVAAEVFLSPDYLARLFKKKTGESINDYINRIRIAAAKEMLNNGEEYVSNIAMAVGFGSATYFSTIFKKMTDMTPNEYKKMVRDREN